MSSYIIVNENNRQLIKKTFKSETEADSFRNTTAKTCKRQKGNNFRYMEWKKASIIRLQGFMDCFSDLALVFREEVKRTGNNRISTRCRYFDNIVKTTKITNEMYKYKVTFPKAVTLQP